MQRFVPSSSSASAASSRIHGVVAADRQDRDVGRVEAADDGLHVAEHARVAGEVELRPVLDRRRRCRTARPCTRASLFELEWCAFVSVNLTPAASTVPPLFGSRTFSTPCLPCSQSAISTGAMTVQPCFFASSTVSPRWSPWPCVSAITSIRSGSQLRLRALRVPVQEGVDVDALPVGRVEAEGRVAEPGQGRFGHA